MGIDNWKPITANADYNDMINSWGYLIVDHAEIGDYQGDYLYVLQDPSDLQLGWLVVGYGSCSACCSLQNAHGNLKEMLELRSEVHSAIVWKPRDEFWEYLAAKDHGGQFYSYLSDMEQWVTNVLVHLRPPLPFSTTTILLIKNEEVDPAILADSLQDDGYEVLPRALRDRTIGAATATRLRKAFLADPVNRITIINPGE